MVFLSFFFFLKILLYFLSDSFSHSPVKNMLFAHFISIVCAKYAIFVRYFLPFRRVFIVFAFFQSFIMLFLSFSHGIIVAKSGFVFGLSFQTQHTDAKQKGLYENVRILTIK